MVYASATFFQRFRADRGAVLGGGLLGVRRNPTVFEISRRLAGAADLFEDGLQPLLEARHHLLSVFDRDVTSTDQRLGVELAD